MTFKDFLKKVNDPMDQGIKKEHNRNDEAERAMIHKIMELNRMPNGRSDENYDLAYTFLESDWGGALWDKYYELFTEKNPKFEGPFNKRRYGNFKQEAVSSFKNWKNGRTFKGPPVTD